MAAPAGFNEELALTARAQAEKCFLAGDVTGARRWARCAARLAPGLPGVAQAYDVHAARDWYAVLGLRRPGAGPPLTHDDVRRRLCLLVHPDKNPSAAADGAFKLVQAAWEALSAAHPPPPGPDASATRPQPQPSRRQPQGQGPPSYADAGRVQRQRAAPTPAPRVPTSPGFCPSCGVLTPFGTHYFCFKRGFCR
ncbi:hypothetical protein BS78_01G171600 [Paspalum vaginatum]|nr:hypothetical protein BS78_01G171600 [Paspalum vaginatum]